MGVGQKRDIITDFNGAEGDRVDLRGLAQSSGLESLTYIGSEAFTDKGQIRFENEILSGSIHGPQVDFEIQLVGVKTFTADDLLL
ncbi:type I secretion C-terminal target domain-containing protein [Pseudomonas sp. SWI6]|nr:type I secretion C-terminal target domain-containing protein [Pseudomonas sp. SWI6]AVD86661.1 type I secretion C-terminal target domain-containing protein [Pseudomonas sp. SWI44]